MTGEARGIYELDNYEELVTEEEGRTSMRRRRMWRRRGEFMAWRRNWKQKTEREE